MKTQFTTQIKDDVSMNNSPSSAATNHTNSGLMISLIYLDVH